MNSFSNYSSDHLLAFERATNVLLARSESSELGLDFRAYRLDGQLRIVPTDDAWRALQTPWFTSSREAQRVYLQEVSKALRTTEREVLEEIEAYLRNVDVTADKHIHQAQFDFAFV